MAQTPSPVIDIKNLRTVIQDQVIHDGISLTIQPGQIFGIVGGSGSGKSVLLNTLLGLMPYQDGTIHLWGKDQRLILNSFAYKKRMGVLFQRGALFSSLTVLQNVCVPLIEQGGLPEAVAQKIALFKLQTVGLPPETAFKLPEALSGGMVKRVALARALALDASLLFLDEPTSGLDPISTEAFDQLIKILKETLGLTIVMITHDIGSLAICDQIGIIVDKKIVTGPLAEVKRNPHPWIKQYFSGIRSQALLGE